MRSDISPSTLACFISCMAGILVCPQEGLYLHISGMPLSSSAYIPSASPTKLHSTWDLHSARNNSFISRENPHRNPYIKSVPVECYQTGNANKHFRQSGHGTTRSMFKLMITTCLCDDFVCLVGLWSARRRCGPSTAISGLIFLRGENGGGSFIGITCACCASFAAPRGA